MTEQELKSLTEQLKSVNLSDMIPQYKELPNASKKVFLEAFQMLVDKEKAKVANEQ